MPTISIDRQDFEGLLGSSLPRPLTTEQIELWLQLVKGELKDHDQETGELRIELQDSNRPDLWSCEGIARQIRTKVSGARSTYSFFRSKARPSHRLLVAPDLERVRPYVAACTAVGYEVTAAGLTQLIQVQENRRYLWTQTTDRVDRTLPPGRDCLPNQLRAGEAGCRSLHSSGLR